MKKKILIAISCFLVIIAALTVLYSEAVFQRGNPMPYISDCIAFDYFYRGFTPIMEDSDSEAFYSVLGARVILTEEDWRDFTQKFCHTAGSFSIPDFSYECLIIDSSMYGSRASENSSKDILKITVKDNIIAITYDEENTSDKIYAINMDGVGHWFVNIVRIKKTDLPFDVEGVYSAGANA